MRFVVPMDMADTGKLDFRKLVYHISCNSLMDKIETCVLDDGVHSESQSLRRVLMMGQMALFLVQSHLTFCFQYCIEVQDAHLSILQKSQSEDCVSSIKYPKRFPSDGTEQTR